MKNEEIINSLKWLIDKSENQRGEVNNSLHSDTRIEALNHALQLVIWQSLDDSEKQKRRINSLAKFRKEGWDEIELLKKIILYEVIIQTLPYIKAINQLNNLNNLISFCENEIKVINRTSGEGAEFSSLKEIEDAFEPYFKAKSNSILFLTFNPFVECYQKIDYLYSEFKRLQNH